MRNRWRASQDGIWTLVLLLIGVHMAYVMRIGGDHFEYRPLDFYWPLLAVPASMGIVHLASRIAIRRWLRRFPPVWQWGARTCAIALFVPVLFYTSAIQGTLLFEGAAIRERIAKLYIELDDSNAAWLLAVPGMPMLVAVSNDLRRQASWNNVASPFTEHREFANAQLWKWKPYENMENGVIPDDALMAGGALGIRFYYLPDLKVIDIAGLTDATVARNPVTKPNHQRIIAHDRRPPPGYLEERGVNFTIRPPVTSGFQALGRAEYAVKVGPALWMPFDSPDRQWVFDRFAGRDFFWVSDRDYLADLLGDSRLVIRSDWDVYLVENSLIYKKEQCIPEDTEPTFFLHLTPVDMSDLPIHRKQYGFDNLDFAFGNHRLPIEGEVCTAVRELPDYGIAAIRTGQFIGEGEKIWEGRFEIVEPADDGKTVP